MWTVGSIGIEGRLEPFDLVLHQHHVKATRRWRAHAQEIVARSENDAPLLRRLNACTRTAECAGSAAADLDEDHCSIAVAEDQVDFPTAAPRSSIIALKQAQSCRLQMSESPIFGLFASLPRGLDGWSSVRAFTRKPHLNVSFASVLRAASDIASGQHYPHGALYMVATPIGNLADISLRALHVLQLVDCIACEDTRHSQSLLRSYGIERSGSQLLAVHQHNEQESAQSVVARLQQGLRVAFVSDAGTPAVSDPGARLVAAVHASELQVVTIPGVSSVTAAISVAGAVAAPGAGSGFVFAGFLPSKPGERSAAIEELRRESRCVVLLEAPHRIRDLVHALTVLGDRRVTLARELTKQFESVTNRPANQLEHWLAGDSNRSRGEFVVILHPASMAKDDALPSALLQKLLPELPLKTAVRIAAEVTGAPRNALYEQALALRQGGESQPHG